MAANRICVLRGDGIGPEVTNEALKVLKAVSMACGFEYELTEGMIGGCAIDACGVPLPEETLRLCRESGAVLLGAVGGEQWDHLPGDLRPEAGLLGIRGELSLYANLRPAKLWPQLRGASPLKDEILGDGINILVVRELTGGIYFGERGRETLGIQSAFDTERYSAPEIQRIVEAAFRLARQRSKKVTSVDKANVLESSRLWREVTRDVAQRYPDVALNHMYIDNAAMQLVRDPRQFDVIVTSNMFGDILSDEASMITGSIGMLPSASMAGGSFGMYEPIHGSAPDIAGHGIANPLAAIMSVSMMLRHSFELYSAAEAIEAAVGAALDRGLRTADIVSDGEGITIASTSQMGDTVAELVCGSGE